MKFATRAAAIAYAKSTHRLIPHKVVKTRYWSCNLWDWVPSWTVVLTVKLGAHK